MPNHRRFARFTVASALLCAATLGLSAAAHQPTNQRPQQPAPRKPAPAPTLKAGSVAPALSVDEWVKGQPVQKFEQGKVYIVEFWATWCPPCIKAIPHLTELQSKHKEDGLTVIGVAGAERASAQGGPDRRLQGVQQFVNTQGKKMDYTVAYDGDRTMWNAWMTPAGRTGIPSSFIVGGDGKIAWIGNPLADEFDAEVSKAINKFKKPSDDKKSTSGGSDEKKQDTDVEKRKQDQRAPFRKTTPADKPS